MVEKKALIDHLEAVIGSSHCTAILSQEGDSIFNINFVNILDYRTDPKDNPTCHLYIAQFLGLVDGDTKEIIRKGIPVQKIMDDVDQAGRMSGGIRPLTAMANLDQLYMNLKRIGYKPISEEQFDGTRIRFIRPPYEPIDKHG